jgi:hypothetical protein
LPPSEAALPWIPTFGLIFPVLTSVFITSVSIAVAYVSVKAYLREGLLGVLFLGCGALVFGSTSLLTSMFLGKEGLNFSGIVFASGAALSSAFSLACAVSTLRGKPGRGRGRQASLWMGVALFGVIAIVVAALEGVPPPFYEAGRGSTALAQLVLGAAAVMLACASALIFNAFSSSRSPVLLRYSMSLGASAAGVLGVILSGGDIQALAMRLGWAALYIGGLLLLTSVLSAERPSGPS